jgi:hypothetical protein
VVGARGQQGREALRHREAEDAVLSGVAHVGVDQQRARAPAARRRSRGWRRRSCGPRPARGSRPTSDLRPLSGLYQRIMSWRAQGAELLGARMERRERRHELAARSLGCGREVRHVVLHREGEAHVVLGQVPQAHRGLAETRLVAPLALEHALDLRRRELALVHQDRADRAVGTRGERAARVDLADILGLRGHVAIPFRWGWAGRACCRRCRRAGARGARSAGCR